MTTSRTGERWLVVAVLSSLFCLMFGENPTGDSTPAKDRLFSKIYGCQVAGAIGDALGDKVEGNSYKEIEKKYGILDHFVESREKARSEQNDYTPDQIRFNHVRAPGMTEDGYERHLLCANAIIRKGGRIDVTDLAQAWRRDIDPNQFGYLLGWQDQFAYYSAWAGVPPKEIGEFASWPGMIGTTKMIMPVGMINAGNPEQAARDALNVARLKDTLGTKENYALEVCSAVAAATAEALKEDATVESVIAAAFSRLSETPRSDAQEMLNAAKRTNDFNELPPIYDAKYSKRGKRESAADEILAGALLAFYSAKGQPREAILNAIRLGRDTDCKAYIAGGLAGALRGIEAVPAEWAKTVEDAAVANPYTVSRRTSRDIAIALHRIVLKNRAGAKGEAEPSRGLEAVIREKARKHEGELTTADYESIVALDAGSRRLSSLNGIERMAHLEWLKLDNNQMTDIRPLKSLRNLVYLDLGSNRISDLSPLSELENLKTLILDHNAIRDIAALRGLTQLRALNLTGNRISDIRPLANMTNLGALYLGENQIGDIRPLAKITNLISLGLEDNRIGDLGALRNLTKPIALYLSKNQIEDVSALSGLTNTLKYLGLNDNRLRNASPLKSLTRLIHLNLSGNRISAITALSGLDKLAYLDLGRNSIPDIRPLAALSKLKHLNVAGNAVSDIQSLRNLGEMVCLRLDNNKIAAIEVVSKMEGLKYLYLSGNPIDDFRPVARCFPRLEEKDFSLNN